MAYTPLRISIPEPCHEDWDGMHPVNGTTARHCDSCAKNVVDFTAFTDAQMHAYVRLNEGKLCGRFRPDQLGRPLRASTRPAGNPLKVAATAAGLMLATSGCDTVKPAQHDGSGLYTVLEQTHPVLPITGGISLEEIELAQTCPPPSPDQTTMGKISASPAVLPVSPVAEPREHAPLEELSTDRPGDPRAEEDVASAPPPPPVAGTISVDDHEVGNTTTIEEILPEGETEAYPGDSVVPLASPPTPHPVIMGMMIATLPEASGMDWVKDTIRKAITPTSSAPQTTAPHPRPRPNELPPHLENLTVYPNPFVSELVVAVELPRAQTMVVELRDPSGRRVHVESFEGTEGFNNFVIEPKRRRLVHAAYHLRVTDRLGRVVTRTVVR